MKPVAMALNILQGESSVHMGLLLPTLYQLSDMLKRLESTCKMCTPLALTTSEVTLTPTWMMSPVQTAASLMKTTSLHPWS
ncbi:hypothetical protein FQN60_002213 [Etheostoma spectabile]|uniref:Uncharacterized protein n=1 Tax=Etheostoma spectabile TaxID=54343 RepID=A0A5J5C7Z7_9PERO|nr:hypothetical protein FQN60_016829 [Etheostoma spectabile]KAA8577870.1 hypothetical protein FQN60_009192 [Etheostoma spectabile]KAA8577872.1 hypothetical protein FQN60_006988 [Etheostoma spectabile]KAA8578500.1 hypothetical protein FQN60_007280 [Etheostoma spectabile]KAA8591270.1 hypothetical protein FQN60_002213 [Etheostoma spectabile]